MNGDAEETDFHEISDDELEQYHRATREPIEGHIADWVFLTTKRRRWHEQNGHWIDHPVVNRTSLLVVDAITLDLLFADYIPYTIASIGMFVTAGVWFAGDGLSRDESVIEDAIDSFKATDFEVPTVSDWLYTAAGFVMMVVGMVSYSMATSTVGGSSADHTGISTVTFDPVTTVALMATMLVFVGPVEELIFRGKLQQWFSGGLVRRIGITSVLFAGLHLLVYGFTIAGVISVVGIFFLSVVLGLLYERTGNLTVPGLAHGAYNATVVLALYVSSAGLV